VVPPSAGWSPGLGAAFGSSPTAASGHSIESVSSGPWLVGLRPGLVLNGLALRSSHARGKLAVRLSFFLSAPAQVTFVVFASGQGCKPVGWFTVAAHRGSNQVLFRGRLQKHQLAPGLYRLVPKAPREAVDSLPTVGIVVDRRGVRPSAPVAWRDCGHVPARVFAPSGVSEHAGVGGISAFKPPSGPSAATNAQPNAPSRGGAFPLSGRGDAFPLSGDSNLFRDAFLLGLLGVSLMLLGLSRFQPSAALARYSVARAVVNRRDEIRLMGVGLLCGTALLFFL
jgi:hypothetical protein